MYIGAAMLGPLSVANMQMDAELRPYSDLHSNAAGAGRKS